MAESPDHFPAIEDTYEAPTVDDELLAALREALANVPNLHEAYLVSRRRSIEGHEASEGLGVVARAEGRWRTRKQVAAVSEALRPFYPPPFDAISLCWGDFGNKPVPKRAKEVGIRLGGHS